MAAVTSSYGPRNLYGRNFHQGVDYSAPVGTPIYANKDNLTVTKAEYQRGYGNVVYAKDSNGIEYRFGHLDSIDGNIKPGTVINKTDVIGHTGNTGDSTGSHLHFEVRDASGRSVDPLKAIDAETGKPYDSSVSFTPSGSSLSGSQAKADPTYKPLYASARSAPTPSTPQPRTVRPGVKTPPIMPTPSREVVPIRAGVPRLRHRINPVLPLGDN